MSLLEVRDVRVTFRTGSESVNALDNVSLDLDAGETLAVVGESGCGKTTLARAVLGLQKLDAGRISIDGRAVEGVSKGQASVVGMVWQDPFASLDPRWTVRDILSEPLMLAGKKPEIDDLLEDIGLDVQMADRYPHQLSGGQRQRVAIGRALALRPPLVICDEPTAALDLSMQAQILNLLRDLQKSRRCAFLYISHDLTTVQFLADRVTVMYMGRVVEQGRTEDVFEHPRHPYTLALMQSAPTLATLGRLPEPAQGEVHGQRQTGTGCRFASRCPQAGSDCRTVDPPLLVDGSHAAACLYPIGTEVTLNR